MTSPGPAGNAHRWCAAPVTASGSSIATTPGRDAEILAPSLPSAVFTSGAAIATSPATAAGNGPVGARAVGVPVAARVVRSAAMRGRGAALGMGLAAVVVWGLSFAATRVAVAEIPPLELAVLRFALGTALLLPVAVRRWPGLGLAAGERRDVALMGLSGVTMAFLFENLGLRHTTASHGAVIVSLTPLATVLVEGVRARRRPAPRVLAGLAAALLGVGLMVGRGGGGEATLLGDGLMLATVGVWVLYTFVAERLGTRYPPLYVTAWAMLAGTAGPVPLAAAERSLVDWGRPGPAEWAAVAYLGVFCSALGYVWWNSALASLGPSTTNALIYGIPLVGVAGGVALLGEPLTAAVVAGAVLVVGGVAVATLGDG